MNGAIFSSCGKYRYRLERDVYPEGRHLVYAFFGVNASTAGVDNDDHTVRKLNDEE